MDILIDFDGTCVSYDFPRIGKDIGAVPVLKRLVKEGHRLILFTMRCDHQIEPKASDPIILNIKGDFLSDAVRWFEDNDIPLYGIQVNPTQHEWTTSPKAYGQIMIDDTALGCPLKFDESISKSPFVDWVKVEELLF